MGLNLVVYDYRFFEQSDYRGDKRLDSSRHYEDHDFVAWLNAGHFDIALVRSSSKDSSQRK